MIARKDKDGIVGLLAASRADDPGAVRAVLEQSSAALGLGPCIDTVLLPAMRQVGAWWQDETIGIETERLTTEAVRCWLETLTLQAPPPDGRPPMVLACGSGERHSLGLEALGVLLRYRLQACRLLGARASGQALIAAIRANRPSGLVLVSHHRASRRGATDSLQQVASLVPALFYAGAAFATEASRRDVPGTYLGTNIEAASDVILDAVAHHVG